MAERKKIFAYGSLINVDSLRSTAPEANNIFPAKVFGFSRTFCLASSYRFDSKLDTPVCVLNVLSNSSDHCLNGICFEIADKNFEALREREQYYSLENVDILDFYREDKAYQGFMFKASGYEPYRYLPGSKEQQHYVRLCLSGCEVYGSEFVNQFRNTTQFWGIENDQDIRRIWEGKY